jgi:hypothetical protein
MSLLQMQSLGAPSTTIGERNVQQSILNMMFDRYIDDIEYDKLSAGINVYFHDWYKEECCQCERQVSVATESELMKIIAYLRDPHETRASIRQKLISRHTAGQTDPPSASELDASITLAARLFLMISIGDFGLSITVGQPIPWGEGSLQEVVDIAFAPNAGSLETFRLPKIFNALNLERIAGIKVCWTSNLADHLLMNDDEGTVTLFHHVTFLKLHRESDWCVMRSC